MYVDLVKMNQEKIGVGGVKEILKDKFITLPKEGRGRDLQTHLFCMLMGLLPARQVKRPYFSMIVFFLIPRLTMSGCWKVFENCNC